MQYQTLRGLLVQERGAAGLSQLELAMRLGRPQSFVSKYERGERRLDLVEFLEVVRALRADPHRILRLVEDPSGESEAMDAVALRKRRR
jgi:transcriptional regulator with XRE-family HTH domain